MNTTTLPVELPKEIVSLLGESDRAAATSVREVVVMELLRRQQISQGKAARVLGIDRWALLDMMARHDVPAAPLTAEEASRDVQNARRASLATPPA
jgi:predicted HTH domain antitoxin